jgi:hypothetical protein
MSSFKQLTYKETLRQVFICLRPLPSLGFCCEWSSNFVGSESGQIQSVKHRQIMSLTGLNTQPHTVPTYCTMTQVRWGGGGGEPERRLEGQYSSQSWVENTNMIDCISSL